MACQESGAAGDVERSGRKQCGDNALDIGHLGEETLSLVALVVDPVVPLVVLRGTQVVVLLHRS